MATTMLKTTSPTFAPFPGNSATPFPYDFQLSSICFLARCSSFAAVNDNKHVKLGLSKSKPSGPSPTHLEKLVIEKCKSRSLKLDEALGFFDSMISLSPLPSIWAFNHLLGALAKMKHYSAVVSMCKQIMGCEEMHPDISTMTTWMNCYCNLKHADLCFSVLALILKLGLPPDPYTMNVLLLGLINEGKIDEALKLFWQIVQTGYPCNVYTCAIIISGLCKSGDFKEVTELLENMIASGIGHTHLEKLVIEKCKSRSFKLDEALELFDFMISQRPLPSIWAFIYLLDALAKMKHYSVVVSMCKQMMMGCEEMQPNIVTMNIFMSCFCNLKQADLCFSVLALILKLGLQPDPYTMNVLLLGLINEGKIDEAMKLFWRMVQKEYPYDECTYNIVINGLCKSGYTCYALQILKWMIGSPSYKPDVVSYSATIDGFCKEGSVDEGVQPNLITFNSEIDALCKEKRAEEAIEGKTKDEVLRNALLSGVRVKAPGVLLNAASVLFM
ncbi:hypothetical protein COLO4_34076 [Corchorus olitorius]|uniref:Pentatricopeptide repeat-containing protein n=1 Tax=Corchorus olitorius TaxID=93759 RepID=A0A1R3GNX1_9ROSI|nr:hypothetical protein COLO4_34076 [Corchorus olitorius]